jgi:hypothetical protein
VLQPEIQTNAQPLQDEVMTLLKEKYTVYLDKNSLPNKLLVKDENGQLSGFRDGFSFSYSVALESERRVKIRCINWVGDLVSSGHWKRCKWTGTDWEIIEKSPMVVS